MKLAIDDRPTCKKTRLIGIDEVRPAVSMQHSCF